MPFHPSTSRPVVQIALLRVLRGRVSSSENSNRNVSPVDGRSLHSLTLHLLYSPEETFAEMIILASRVFEDQRINGKQPISYFRYKFLNVVYESEQLPRLKQLILLTYKNSRMICAHEAVQFLTKDPDISTAQFVFLIDSYE